MADTQRKNVDRTVKVDGFEVELEDISDDLEVLDAAVAIENGNVTQQQLIAMMHATFGADFRAVREHLRDEAGHVSALAMLQFTLDAINALGEKTGAVKN